MGTKFGTTVQKIIFDLSVVIRVHCDRSEEGGVQRTSLNTGAWRIPMGRNALYVPVELLYILDHAYSVRHISAFVWSFSGLR